jgi:nucleotide-binding universal stress UspA family protein
MNAENAAVVVAVDGTVRSAGALRYAVAEVRERGGTLRVIHVSPEYVPMTPYLPYLPSEIAAEGRAILSEAEVQVRALDPDLDVVTELMKGTRTRGILTAAEDAALLVVGHETRGVVDRLVTGGTTAKVVARATCPVVVVPSSWEPTAPKGRVVLGVKSAAHAEELMATAFEVASARGATLVVVHAWKLPDPYLDVIEQRAHADEWRIDGEQMLRRVLAEWRVGYPGVPVEIQVLHAAPADALVTAGEDADVVLLVRRTHDPLHTGHLGTTARKVLQLAVSPVEVLPATDVPVAAPDLVLEKSGQLLK